MTKILLLSLTLTNFKGITSLQVSPNGESLDVFGRNATGKTTLVDAVLWLLFGKDSQGRADYRIVGTDESGQPVLGLDHSVEGVFLVGGRTVTLKRVLKEVYVKSRGALVPDFKGYTTDYYYDGAPMPTAKEYEARVAKICDPLTFRILTDPAYFSEQLPWKDRRRVLVEAFGDMTDEEVIASNEKLADLGELLEGRTVEDFRAMSVAGRKKAEDELEGIQPRIDQTMKVMPEEVKGDHAATVEALERELDAAREERAGIASGGAVAKYQAELNDADAKLSELRAKLASQGNPARDAALALQRSLNEQIQSIESEVRSKTNTLESDKRTVTSLEAELETLRVVYAGIKAKVYEGDGLCPSCKQPLPADQLETVIAAFNEAKSKQLEANIARGGEAKKSKEDAKKRIAAAQSAIDAANARLVTLKAELDALVIPEESAVDYTKDAEYLKALQAKNEAHLRLVGAREDSASVLAQADAKVARANEAWQAAAAVKAQQDARARGLAEVERLREHEQSLAKTIEGWDRKVWLCEEFVRTRSKLLTERINQHFELARFELFRPLQNGGLEECCEAWGDSNGCSVPFSALNQGARVNVGLDIIRTMHKVYGYAPLILIDGAESVTGLIDIDCQVIRLVVSASDKSLRFEPHSASLATA